MLRRFVIVFGTLAAATAVSLISPVDADQQDERKSSGVKQQDAQRNAKQRDAKPRKEPKEGAQRTTARTSKSSGKKSAKPIRITSSRERQALKFAKQHHAELANLVMGLKTTDQDQYRSAITDILRDRDRLEKVADTDRGKLQIEIWKLNSRIRLETARSSMNGSVKPGASLVLLLKKRNTVRLELYEMDRERLLQRLERTDSQISALRQKTDETIAKEAERLQRSIVARTRQSTKSRKPSKGGRVEIKVNSD